ESRDALSLARSAHPRWRRSPWTPDDVTPVHARAHDSATLQGELGMRAEELRGHVQAIAIDEAVSPLQDAVALAGVEDGHEDVGPDSAPGRLAGDRRVAERVVVEQALGIERRHDAAVPGEPLAQAARGLPDGIMR